MNDSAAYAVAIVSFVGAATYLACNGHEYFAIGLLVMAGLLRTEKSK